jgi:hypothetical protein
MQFFVSGPFTSLGQCLSAKTTSESSGITVVEPCNSLVPEQFWDFHF